MHTHVDLAVDSLMKKIQLGLTDTTLQEKAEIIMNLRVNLKVMLITFAKESHLSQEKIDGIFETENKAYSEIATKLENPTNTENL